MTHKKPVFVALLNTRSFEFVAVGRSETEARAAMRAAWDEHRKQLDGVAPWATYRDAVAVFELRAGQSVRDGNPLADLFS